MGHIFFMNPNHFFVKKLTQLDALGDTVLTWFTFIVDNVDNTDTSGIVLIFALVLLAVQGVVHGLGCHWPRLWPRLWPPLCS